MVNSHILETDNMFINNIFSYLVQVYSAILLKLEFAKQAKTELKKLLALTHNRPSFVSGQNRSLSILLIFLAVLQTKMNFMLK